MPLLKIETEDYSFKADISNIEKYREISRSLKETVNRLGFEVSAKNETATDFKPNCYSGFLYIRCEHCGKEKGFYTKGAIDHFHCDTCEKVTDLVDLMPLFANCECGKFWRYKTNIKDKVFDIPCFECGSPISIQENKKAHKFETIK